MNPCIEYGTIYISYCRFAYIHVSRRLTSNARKNIFENFSIRNYFADISLTNISAKIGHR